MPSPQDSVDQPCGICSAIPSLEVEHELWRCGHQEPKCRRFYSLGQESCSPADQVQDMGKQAARKLSTAFEETWGSRWVHAFGFHREIMTSCWHSGFLSGTVARSSLGRVNANTSVALVLYSSRFVSKAAVQRKCICRAGAGRSLECVVAESTGLPG